MKTGKNFVAINFIIALVTLLLLTVLQSCDDKVTETPSENDQVQSKLEAGELNTLMDYETSVERIKIKLGLTDEQTDQIKAIIKEHVKKIKNNLPENFWDLSFEEKRNFLAPYRTDLKSELKRILTEEQVNILLELRDNFISNRQQLLAALNLYDKQKDQIKELLKDRFNSPFFEIEGVKNRTAERQKFRNEFLQILTEEQKAILKEFLLQHRQAYLVSP